MSQNHKLNSLLGSDGLELLQMLYAKGDVPEVTVEDLYDTISTLNNATPGYVKIEDIMSAYGSKADLIGGSIEGLEAFLRANFDDSSVISDKASDYVETKDVTPDKTGDYLIDNDGNIITTTPSKEVKKEVKPKVAEKEVKLEVKPEVKKEEIKVTKKPWTYLPEHEEYASSLEEAKTKIGLMSNFAKIPKKDLAALYIIERKLRKAAEAKLKTQQSVVAPAATPKPKVAPKKVITKKKGVALNVVLDKGTAVFMDARGVYYPKGNPFRAELPLTLEFLAHLMVAAKLDTVNFTLYLRPERCSFSDVRNIRVFDHENRLEFETNFKGEKEDIVVLGGITFATKSKLQ